MHIVALIRLDTTSLRARADDDEEESRVRADFVNTGNDGTIDSLWLLECMFLFEF